MSKSKRIKEAARELERALKKHVDVVTDSAVSMKKAQRAGARLASAAQLYAEAVQAKTGLDNPFLTGGGKLDDEATESLRAERNEIAKTLTGSIATIEELPAEVDLSAAGSAAPSPEASVVYPPADWADDSVEVDDEPTPPPAPVWPLDESAAASGGDEHAHSDHEHADHEHHDHGYEHEHHEHAADEEQPPALPEQEPRSEEDKPYSEDI